MRERGVRERGRDKGMRGEERERETKGGERERKRDFTLNVLMALTLRLLIL